jgi:hypothetical protein
VTGIPLERARMMIDVAKLLEALHRACWKHGMVQPDRMRHVVNPDGSHTIALTLAKADVKWAAPKHLERPAWGASTPEGAGGRKK